MLLLPGTFWTILEFTFQFCSCCSLMLLLPDVLVCCDCNIYHNCSLLLFINHHCVWLVDQQLLVPQDFSPVVLNQL